MTAESTHSQDGGQQMRVLLADEDKDRLGQLAELIGETGHVVLDRAVTVDEVAGSFVGEDPDIAIVLVCGDWQHAIDLLGQLRAFTELPVVLASDEVPDDLAGAAAEMALQIVHVPQTAAAMQATIETAVTENRRHAEALRRIGDLEGALERRAVIERAKGVLMERHGLSERDAFEELRTHARSSRRRIVDVADAVVDVRDLLSPGIPVRDGDGA